MSEQDGAYVSIKPGRSGQVTTQKTMLQRPANDDKEAWKAYWKAQDQSWRTEPEIDLERQKYLDERRSAIPDFEKGIYPFRDIKLSRADIEWLLVTHENGHGQVDWSDDGQREHEGLDLRGAVLRRVNLSHLPLKGSNLSKAHLEEADLSFANLEGVELGYTHLEYAELLGVHLEGAFLNLAHLENANLNSAYLQYANLNSAQLQGTDLSFVDLKKPPFGLLISKALI
jgi:Pentapeptide repeats (8 copies)